MARLTLFPWDREPCLAGAAGRVRRVRLSGTKTSGEKSDVWFRHTLCFRKIRNEWKIAHAHESVPFYMDSTYKAAVDLRP